MKNQELIDVVFTWSIDDVLNRDLIRNKVSYQNPTEIFILNRLHQTFIDPLLEETHAQLLSSMNIISRASTCEIKVRSETKSRKFPNYHSYAISLENKSRGGNYEPEVGDLIVLTNVKPRCIDDLKPYVIALVQFVKNEDHGTCQVISSKPIPLSGEQTHKFMPFAVHLMNLTTNTRIWQALHPSLDGNKNMKMINKVLQTDSVIRAFVRTLRPVIIIDATHLKGEFKGTLFLAVGMDGNHQILPIGYEIGKSEDGNSWTWFLSKLKDCIGDHPELAIISDRAPSIQLAVRAVFRQAFHGLCCRHLMVNLKLPKKNGKRVSMVADLQILPAIRF
ncbi:putative MULE transposase domain-containing protein [Helianthus debilis subsp. tardiflorus]